MLTATLIHSTPVIITPELLCVAEGFEDMDKVDLVAVLVFTVVVADVLGPDVELVVVVEFSVVFGVLTRNQSAATGAPKPVSATKFVRLKPTRSSTEDPGAVKLLNKGI